MSNLLQFYHSSTAGWRLNSGPTAFKSAVSTRPPSLSDLNTIFCLLIIVAFLLPDAAVAASLLVWNLLYHARVKFSDHSQVKQVYLECRCRCNPNRPCAPFIRKLHFIPRPVCRLPCQSSIYRRHPIATCKQPCLACHHNLKRPAGLGRDKFSSEEAKWKKNTCP